MRILVVEDDDDISALLKRGFELEGYEVDCAANGELAIERAGQASYDSIILDVMLPGCSGLEVCRAVREMNDDSSIIMLSARDTVPDRIEGLGAGADDYVVKPFAFEELLARVQAQERKKKSLEGANAGEGGAEEKLTIDTEIRKVSFGDKSVILTEREADLLLLFMEHDGKPLSREQIYGALWGSEGGARSMSSMFMSAISGANWAR